MLQIAIVQSALRALEPTHEFAGILVEIPVERCIPLLAEVLVLLGMLEPTYSTVSR